MFGRKPTAVKPQQAVPARQCPAKTRVVDGVVCRGLDVYTHTLIVGQVAQALIARMPVSLASKFPSGVALLAALHDLGKVSPYFYEKLRRAYDPQGKSTLPVGMDPSRESDWGGHAGVSLEAAVSMGIDPLLAEAIGQHHGFRPPTDSVWGDCPVFGGPEWQVERVRLVDDLSQALGETLPADVDSGLVRLWAGLVCVADWIGSGELFEDPPSSWEALIPKALDSAGFFQPRWKAGLSFDEVFPFKPHPAQVALIDQVKGPGVYVFEAPMGLGKTEAALYAAYKCVSEFGASGIYFALPTQLTSNAVHSRFTPFLERITDGLSSAHRTQLLHSGAWLIDTEVGEEGTPGGSWFAQGKRGILAPTAVGTIDQALMAVMNVKHGFVRAFGLAGKVVILDEVHSYDLYTGTILKQLVSELRKWGATVIILSATLASSRRGELVGGVTAKSGYPLITASGADGLVEEVEVEEVSAAKHSAQVGIQWERSDDQALQLAVEKAKAGQQVLWVENTVASAQDVYFRLKTMVAGTQIDCGLLHSRFTKAHRQKNEKCWVDTFGKAGKTARHERGRILVGTQVVEQSLDIDADYLFTRFAPTDMLLQRFGRLWRHGETKRPQGASRSVTILAPELDAAIQAPKGEFGVSAFVYAPYVLCRSLEVMSCRQSVALPGDIRELVESTYTERTEDGAMSRWLHVLDEGERGRLGRKAQERIACATLATTGNEKPDTPATTRLVEQDSIETLLTRKIDLLGDGAMLTLLDGAEVRIYRDKSVLTKRAWREIAVQLHQQTVTLRPSNAPGASPRLDLLKHGFGNVFYLGHGGQKDAEVRIGLVAPDGRVSGLSEQASPKKNSMYSDDLGYQVILTKD